MRVTCIIFFAEMRKTIAEFVLATVDAAASVFTVNNVVWCVIIHSGRKSIRYDIIPSLMDQDAFSINLNT